jgi:hypothetical protein
MMLKVANGLTRKVRVRAKAKRARTAEKVTAEKAVLKQSATNSVTRELASTETIADMTTMLRLPDGLRLER